MKILILGNGFLGTKLAKYFKADVCIKPIHTITKEDLDYDVVINTMAMTDVDWCEKNDCYLTNTIQAGRVANLTRGKYVFISTGCIFPVPLCHYAWSKVYAESIIRSVKKNHLILRPRLLISEKKHPRNTITKILNYKLLSIEQESMTIIEDMLPYIKKLIAKDKVGTINVLNADSISPSEIADIFNVKHTKATKKQIEAANPEKVKRTTVVLKGVLPNIRKRIKQIKVNYENT